MFGVGPVQLRPVQGGRLGPAQGRRFRAVGPVDGRPVDARRHLLFPRLPVGRAGRAPRRAPATAPSALDLIGALTFRDAKRPVTKAVLQRIDLAALLAHADRAALLDRAGASWPIAGRTATGRDRDTDRLDRRDPAAARRPRATTPEDHRMAFATINYFSRSLEEGVVVQHRLPRRPGRSRAPGRSSTCCTGSPTTTRSGCGGRASSGTSRGCRWWSSCPTAAGAGTPTPSTGYAYEDDLIKDVVGLVDRTFPVKAERSGRAIGGLSMGGYGAVKLGLKHHEMFASVNSHSGALGFLRRDPREGQASSAPSSRGSSATTPKGGPEDPFAIVERIDHGRIPALRIDCGTDDFLLDQNRAFHKHLEIAAHPPRVPGVPRRPRLGLLGQARPARPSRSTSGTCKLGRRCLPGRLRVHDP